MTVPDSGLDKKVVPLVAVQVDGFIGRVWEKQDGRHGVCSPATPWPWPCLPTARGRRPRGCVMTGAARTHVQ